jgi:enoyl-[acyl-carrier protein] reductase III
MIELRERIALVTGGSRGIGRACAVALARAGADVIVNYRTQEAEAEATAAMIAEEGSRVAIVKADVGEAEDCASMCSFIAERFGRLDILIHNAASGGFRPLLDASTAQFDAAMHTNALSLLHLLRHAAPLMKERPQRSKVVVLSSAGTHRALPSYGLVGASKAALAAMARHLVLELGDAGININIIEAGLVDTDSTRNLPDAETMFDARRANTLVGDRLLAASDVADAALFLCSPLADLIQGQTLVVDAGSSILP